MVGLTLGLTVSFFALLHVNFELSYDSYHKNADHIYRVVTDGNLDNIYILSVIACFVLLIEAFNFVNLTTAFSLQRAKEIGVRKVLGASRSQLIFQFLSDVILLSVSACFLSILLVTLLMPLFQRLSGKIIDFGLSKNIQDIGWFVLLALTIGLLSGIYPAFFQSGFKPINSLRGKLISPSKVLD